MSGTVATFSDADTVDIRRYCGYPSYGTGAVIIDFTVLSQNYEYLQNRLINMTTTEAAVVQTYLVTLRTLEAAIPGAGANLDTDAAAVWTHNKNEVADRDGLFDGWRRRLCGFIGLRPGPALGDGGSYRVV